MEKKRWMMTRKKESPQRRPWTWIIGVLLFLGIVSVFFAGVLGILLGVEESTMRVGTGNVALIAVEGPILSKSDGILTQTYASSTDIVKLIEKAEKDASVKAIALWINSPGGSAVASDEIAHAIQKSNKTSVAIIREMGTSGAYWVASATDHIIAHRASFTGSIGVIASYVEFADLMTEYNLTYRRLVSGKHKDMGSPLKHMSGEEQELFQESLDDIHALFIEVVAKNRNLSVDDVRRVATGRFFTAGRAKEYGLVDELGGKDEARAYLQEKLGVDVKFVEFKKRRSLFSVLGSTASESFYAMGRGVGDAMVGSGSPTIRT